MAFQTQQEVVEWYRNFRPNSIKNKSDEEIYNMAADWVKQSYGKEIKPFNPITTPTHVEGHPLKPFSSPTNSLEAVDTSPEAMVKLYRLANNIDISDTRTRLEQGKFGEQTTDYATAGMAQLYTEKGADWGFMKASPEFFKYAYNNSTAGLAYAAINGEEAYDYGDYKPDSMAEIGALVVGMYSVPEALAFVLSGGAGNLAAKGSTTLLSKYALLGMKVSNTRKVGGRALLANLIEGGIETGVSLGGLGAAHATAASAQHQRMKVIDKDPNSPTYGKGIGRIDLKKTSLDAAEGFLESFVIGVPAGLVKGGMAAKYGMAALTKNPGVRETVVKSLTGSVGQTSAEILAFTAMPNLYKELGIKHFKDQPDINSKEWRHQLLTNTVVVGHMAAFSRGWKKLKGLDDSHTWSNQILRQAYKDIKQIKGKTDKVASELRESNIDITPEMMENINKLYTKETTDGQAIKDFELYKEQVYDTLQKPRSEWTKEEYQLVAERGPSIVLTEMGLWADLKENPEKFRQILNELAIKEGKKEISDETFETYKKILDNKINEYADIFESLGKEIAIDWDDRPLKDDEVKLILTKPLVADEAGTPFPQKGKIVKRNSEDYDTRMAELNDDGTPRWKELGAPDRVTTPGEPIVRPGTFMSEMERMFSDKLEQQKREIMGLIGVADVQEAVKIVKYLQENDLATITSESPQHKQGWTFLQSILKKKIHKGEIYPQITNEKTLAALVEWISTGGKITSTDGKYVGEMLEWLNIQAIDKITFDDISRYRDYKMSTEGGGLTAKQFSGRLTPIVKFFNHAEARGFIREAPLRYHDPRIKPWWGEATEAERVRAKEIKKIVGEIIEEIGGHDTVNKQIKSIMKEKGNTEEQAYILAHMQDGFGLRTLEVNALKPRNIMTEEGGYVVNVTSRVSKGKARKVPITKELYDLFVKTIKENNITEEEFIFRDSDAVARAVMLKSGVGEAMAEQAKKKGFKKVQQKMELFGRKLAESGLLSATWKSVTTKDYVKQLMGHESWSDKVYGKSISEKQERQIRQTLRDWMDKKISTENAERRMHQIAGEEFKYQWETDISPANVREFSEWLDRKLKENPGLAIRKLEDAKYTGKFATGIIDVVMGKANKLTFFHENAHRLKAMIDSTGNKSLSGLWKQAEKIFAKEFTPEIEKKYEKYKKKDRLEEFISDELAKYSLGREQTNTMRGKMKAWTSRLWSNIKRVIFGKENLTKRDMQNILGNKVYKGFTTSDLSASKIAKYQLGPEEFAKQLHKDFNFIAKKAEVNLRTGDKKALIEMIAKEAGIEKPESFRLGDATMGEQDMFLFSNTLDAIPFERLKGDAFFVERFRIRSEVNNIVKQILSPKQQENILMALGVPDGSMWTATKDQLRAYQDIVMGLHDPKRNGDRVSWLRSSMGEGELAKAMSKMDGILGYLAEKSLPVGEVIKLLGLDKLGAKLESHVDAELHHIGQFITFENRAKKLVGKDWNGVFWKGLKDSFVIVMDTERYIERLETNSGKNKLSSTERHLMSKAFKSDFIIEKDGKYIKNPKYKGDKIREAFNTKNKEGQVIELWKDYTDNMHEAFKTAVKNSLTEVEWLNFEKDNNINWIKDGIYVSRLLTPEFKKAFNIHGKNMDKLIEKQAVPIAKELAEKKYKNPTEEQIFREMEDAKTVVLQNLYDMFNFGKGRHQSRFLKKRHVKLPEFVEGEGGKIIKVYETNYEKTLKQYSLGMSKFLANTEIFPEYVQLKGFNFPGAQAEIAKLQLANPKWGNWVKEQVESQLGYGKNWTDYGDMFTHGLGHMAQILAKTQLSFPTSGLKNLVLGQTATLQAFKTSDWFRSLVTVMSKEFRDEVKAMGATEVGLRHIDEFVPVIQKPLNVIFTLGGMKTTENFNRYMSIAASKLQQQRLVNRMQGTSISSRKSKKSITRLKGFYKLTDGEIGLLKEYGMGGVENHTFKTKYEKSKVKRNLERVYQKMNTMAHINTQGASMRLFMPKWAEGRFLRPMTLFKRMAYASTVNTFRNLNVARKNGDYGRIIATMLGPVVTGAVLVAIYDKLLGVDAPKQNSAWYQYLYHLALRGESLGVASDFLRYFEGEGAEMTMYPAIYNWADSALFQVAVPLWQGKKTWSQSGHDFARETLGTYRGAMNIIHKKNNDFNRGMVKFRNMYFDEFWKEVYPNADEKYLSYERNLTTRSPYYRDFKETFYKGTRDEFAKSAISMVYAVAVDLFNTGVNAKGEQKKYANFDEAMKQSVSILTTKLKSLNPNPGTFLRGNKRIALSWHQWLDKDPEKGKQFAKELRALEGEYKYKIRLFRSQDFSKYMKDPEMRKFIDKELRKLK